MVDGGWLNSEDGLFLGDKVFMDEVDGDLDGRGGSSLSVSALQDVEFSLLDGEFYILHILEMFLELQTNVEELLVDFGHQVLELLNLEGGSDTGDDVFSLSVHQELAHKYVLTSGWVSGEGNTGSGGVAHVTEDHGHDVDSGAVQALDVVELSVDDGLVALP